MKNRIAILLILIMTISLMTSCGSQDNPSGDVETFTTETNYGELQYPTEFKNDVKTTVQDEGMGQVVHYETKDGKKLFDIGLNYGCGTAVGTYTKDGETVTVYVKDYDVKDDDVSKQEALNVILDYLTEKYGLDPTGENVEEDDSTFTIETSLCDMEYPTKWKDKVTIKTSDKGVKFSCGDVKLFDLVFGKTKAKTTFLLGTYDGKEIYIVDYLIDKSKYDEHTYMTYCGMQEDINVILHNLEKNSKFEINLN